MPFTPPPATIAFWQRAGSTVATDADIEFLESRLGGKAPPSYVEFMKTFGDVEFNFDVDCQFAYAYEGPDGGPPGNQVVGHIKTPERALRYYEGWQKDPEVNLPAHLLPFAQDLSQGELLIEFGQPTERIFYWNFDEHDWGSGVVRLAFVADNMYDFINNLKPDEQP